VNKFLLIFLGALLVTIALLLWRQPHNSSQTPNVQAEETRGATPLLAEAGWERLRQNFRGLFLGEAAPSQTSVARTLTLLDPDGRFSDLRHLFPEQSAGPLRREDIAEVRKHLQRLLGLARTHASGQGDPDVREALEAKIALALQVWLDADPQAGNAWYFRQIAFPTNLARVALVFAPELRAKHPELLQRIGQYLAWSIESGKQNMRGSNGMDVAFLGLVSAILTENELLFARSRAMAVNLLSERDMEPPADLIERARLNGYNSLTEEEKTRLLETEGIQPDGSFTQHNLYGRQLYLAGYGANYLRKASWIFEGLRDTSQALTPQQLAPVAACFVDCVQWVVFRGRPDPCHFGRYNQHGFFAQPGVKDSRAAGYSFAESARLFLASDVPRKDEWQQALHRLEDPDATPLSGNRMFHTMDYMVHRRPGLFASCRMTSDRTVGNEAGHGHGRWNFHTGDGVLLLLTEGNEYEGWSTEFDGRHLPGTTVLQQQGPLPEVNWGWQAWGGSDFSGGASDGSLGVCGFVQDRGGIRAQKGYFFLDDAVIVTGSGISAEHPDPAYTTMEWMPGGGAEAPPVERGAPFTFKDRGFVVFDADDQTTPAIVAETRPDGTPVQALVLNHGDGTSGGRFAYGIWPDATRLQTRLPHIITTSGEDGHLVEDLKAGTLGLIAFQKGRFRLQDGSEIEVDQPCFLLIRKNPEKWIIHAAAPADRIPRKLKLTFNDPSQPHATDHSITIDLPGGAASGRTITSEMLAIKQPTLPHQP
jgi:chondroitin AC lyase